MCCADSENPQQSKEGLGPRQQGTKNQGDLGEVTSVSLSFSICIIGSMTLISQLVGELDWLMDTNTTPKREKQHKKILSLTFLHCSSVSTTYCKRSLGIHDAQLLRKGAVDGTSLPQPLLLALPCSPSFTLFCSSSSSLKSLPHFFSLSPILSYNSLPLSLLLPSSSPPSIATWAPTIRKHSIRQTCTGFLCPWHCWI